MDKLKTFEQESDTIRKTNLALQRPGQKYFLCGIHKRLPSFCSLRSALLSLLGKLCLFPVEREIFTLVQQMQFLVSSLEWGILQSKCHPAFCYSLALVTIQKCLRNFVVWSFCWFFGTPCVCRWRDQLTRHCLSIYPSDRCILIRKI